MQVSPGEHLSRVCSGHGIELYLSTVGVHTSQNDVDFRGVEVSNGLGHGTDGLV